MDIKIPGYNLQRQIGEGGMARVFIAIQESFDRKVAVKVLTPAKGVEKEQAERFISEAKTIATLNHPHIVPVYDVGKVDERYYITMEHLAGDTLAYWMRCGLEEMECLQVVLEMAEALDYAHQKGIVHRDIKPDNIMFRDNHSSVLTDFGVAISTKGKMDVALDGKMIGTPLYMSPEQARGMPVDGRSDLYSLGAVMFEMFSGHPPYEADDAMAVALAHVTEPIPALPEIHERFQPLINKLMAKKPEDRFENGMAFAKTLKKYMQGTEEQELEPAVVSEDAPDRDVLSDKLRGDTASEYSSINQADPSEGKQAIEPKGPAVPVPTKNFEIEISSYKAMKIFERSMFAAKGVCEEAGQMSLQCGQIRDQLFDWLEEYGKKAQHVHLEFFIKPWLLEKLEEYLAEVIAKDGPYDFLQKAKVEIIVYDLSGMLLKEC